MKILFIYTLHEIQSANKPLNSQEQIQFGISYISALLKQKGHDTKLVVLSKVSGVKTNKKILNKIIENFRPSIVCFTAIFSEYKFVQDIAEYLKNTHKDIFLLIGGVHASLNPDRVIRDNFDALCIGEGEYPTLELINFLEQGISPSGIRNLWIKRHETIEKNPTRPFLENLDKLPFPDREMWQEWIEERYDSQHSVLLGRGCPFECTYCCNHALRKIADGNYIRLRSIDKIIDELKMIHNQFPDSQNIYFEIESFYINKQWSLELCSKLENLNKTLSRPLRFGVNLRITPKTSYSDLFLACKKSNFRFINIGLESGSEKIRQSILRRNYSNDDVINAVNSARENRLQVAFYNLIGLPEETLYDFGLTLKINRSCLPDWILTSIFLPYPGTDLYNLCERKGYLDKTVDSSMERTKPILNLPTFPKKAIQKKYEWFYYDVYKGYKPIYFLLNRVFVAKLRAWPVFFNFYIAFTRLHIYKKLRLVFKREHMEESKIYPRLKYNLR